MDIDKNARTTPHSRALIAARVAAGEPRAAVAQDVGVCERTVRKGWPARPRASWVWTTARAGRIARPGDRDRAAFPPTARKCRAAGHGVEVHACVRRAGHEEDLTT